MKTWNSPAFDASPTAQLYNEAHRTSERLMANARSAKGSAKQNWTLAAECWARAAEHYRNGDSGRAAAEIRKADQFAAKVVG